MGGREWGVNEKSDVSIWRKFLQLTSAASKVRGKEVKVLKNMLT